MRDARLHRGTPRGSVLTADLGGCVRRPLRSPLGRLEGRPAVARLRPRTRRGAFGLGAGGRPDARIGPGRASQTLRRRRGDRLCGRRRRGDLRFARRRYARGVVDELRSVPGAGGRQFAARQPDRRQPGLGQSPGAFAGRRHAGLAGHGAARLRGRSVPGPAGALRRLPAGGRAGSVRGLGPLGVGPCLLGRRGDPARDCRRPRPGQPVRGGCGGRHGNAPARRGIGGRSGGVGRTDWSLSTTIWPVRRSCL